MRVGKWLEENVEVRYPLEPEEERGDAQARKLVRLRIGGVFLRGGKIPRDGGTGLIKIMLGGTILLILLAGILGIADAIAKLR